MVLPLSVESSVDKSSKKFQKFSLCGYPLWWSCAPAPWRAMGTRGRGRVTRAWAQSCYWENVGLWHSVPVATARARGFGYEGSRHSLAGGAVRWGRSIRCKFELQYGHAISSQLMVTSFLMGWKHESVAVGSMATVDRENLPCGSPCTLRLGIGRMRCEGSGPRLLSCGVAIFFQLVV